jgi:hypothetical protein
MVVSIPEHFQIKRSFSVVLRHIHKGNTLLDVPQWFFDSITLVQ